MKLIKFNNILKVIIILKSLRGRRLLQLFFSLLLMLITGFAEFINLGITAIFLQTIINNSSSFNSEFIQKIYGFIFPYIQNSNKNWSLLITFAFSISILIITILRLGTYWYNSRLSASIGVDLAKDSFTRLLSQNYYYFLESNSNETISTLTIQISQAVGSINYFLQFFSGFFITISIFLSLCLINPNIAINSIFIFGLIYFFISYFSTRRTRNNSRKTRAAEEYSIKLVQESLGNIKDVILTNNINFYVNSYTKCVYPMRIMQAENNFIGFFPRYFIEGIALILLAFIAFISIKNDSKLLIPSLGTLAIGAQRILPCFQQSYASWTGLNTTIGGTEKVASFLELSKKSDFKVRKKLDFKKLSLKNVSFKYSGRNEKIIKNLNLEIKKGEKIGIIGETGSGKSTFLDIVMGLLEPTEGDFLINGISLNDKKNKEHYKAWQNNLSNVPQNIFLSDSSIMENIAFGQNYSNINKKEILNAIKKSKLDKFVDILPNGINTIIGENAKKLSGGQKQRIAIARCLYKKSNFIVLDEITSSLDSLTEKEVMNTIYSLDKENTILIVAHKLSTLKGCDRIYRMKDSRLILEQLS